MYDISGDLMDALGAGPSVIAGLLKNCTEQQARTARGGDEGWSVVEVICHLRDAEERALERTRSMRQQKEPLLVGYDQEQLAIENNYAADNLQTALNSFIEFRRQHLAELAALAPEDWQRTGQHEEQGLITISTQASHMAAHDMIHAAQIAHQLKLVE